jgi:hypothetical protein
VALKNFPAGHLLRLPWYTALRYFEQLRVVLSGAGSGAEFNAGGSRGAIVKALIKGICDSLGGMPRMLRKRRRLMKQRRLPTREFAGLLRRHRITFRELLDDQESGAAPGDPR